MKSTSFFFILFLVVGSAHAQDVNINKSQSQCESEIASSSFGTRDEKKNKSICKDNPQSVINCASDLAKTRMLSHTFDSALAECKRQHTSEPKAY